jgi:hypothetical protein
MKFLSILLTASLSTAEIRTVPVRITSVPEPIRSLYSVLHTKNIGLHTVRMCDQGEFGVNLDPEIVFQALKDLPAMTVERAEIVVRDAYNHNKKLVIVRLLEYGVIIATFIVSGGVITLAPKFISALGMAIPTIHVLGDKLAGEVPSLASILGTVLVEEVVLSAAGTKGQCQTRTVFTPVIPKKDLKKYDVTINVVVAPLPEIPAKTTSTPEILPALPVILARQLPTTGWHRMDHFGE